MKWTPGRRRSERALEDPYDDVPPHLLQPLWNWIATAMRWGSYDSTRSTQVALDLRLHVTGNPEEFFLKRCNEDPGLMLDMAECLLERYGNLSETRAWELTSLLEAANSAYAVAPGSRALEHRVAPGVKAVVQVAAEGAPGSAGDHLVSSWSAAYGRRPDPAKAYSEAIKAAEASLAPHVSPQNVKQTLGTMVADIRNKPEKWEFALVGSTSTPGLQAVLGMMEVLWAGQSSRHGGAAPTRLETIDEARAAVHLAAALVQFGHSGALSAA